MADDDSANPSVDPVGGGRRQGDRRRSQQPFEGVDRRKADRRTGANRRASPRDEALE